MYKHLKGRTIKGMCESTKIENEDIRKLYVEIELDSNKAEKAGVGEIEYLEQELGWLKDSGIKFNNAFIADDDEDDPYAAYINYVTDWCFKHSGDEVVRKPLLSYYDWVKDYYKFLSEKYDVKLESPWFVADYLINSIGSAPNTTLGNKCSPFLHFYRDNKGIMLCAAIEEKKLGLRPEEWHYSLYITDNKGEFGEYYSTKSLSEDELANLLKDIFTEIENRLYFRIKHLNEKSVFSKLGFILPNNAMIRDKEKNVMTFNTLPECCVWMRNNGFSEKEIASVKPIFTIGICKKCGNYLFPSFSEEYACQCFNCDEDFYECEQELQKREAQ